MVKLNRAESQAKPVWPLRCKTCWEGSQETLRFFTPVRVRDLDAGVVFNLEGGRFCGCQEEQVCE